MSGKKGHCQTCDYIRSHRGGNRVNEDLVNGISISAIMQRTGLGRGTLTRHRDEGHMMKGYKSQAHLTKGAKEQLDLMRCAKEIYDDCKDNAAKAKGKAESSRDFRDASGCWDAATKALSVLKPEDKTPITNNINLTDPFTRIKAYEKYFMDMENDPQGESASSGYDTGKPILQAKANQETGRILSK